MLISNSLLMSSANLAIRELDEPSKIYHPRILHNQDIFALPEEKQGLIDLPHLKVSLK
jgi:hypothetical protein